MKLRLLTASLVLTLLAMFVVMPLSASAAPKPKPTTGTAELFDANDVLIGTVTNLEAVTDGTVVTITGTLTTVLNDVFSFSQTLVDASGTCQILLLDLGPLFLDLLGLQVDLSRVVLEITAQEGAGNLLGNLLCAVVNLLNDGGLLSDLTDLLTQIFRRLG
jgi:uncharacterized protein YdeI (BOF family)